MKAYLIIEDVPGKPGSVEVNVMRQLTSAEIAADTGKFETPASRYLLAVEGVLMALLKEHQRMETRAALRRKAVASIREPGKCLN